MAAKKTRRSRERVNPDLEERLLPQDVADGVSEVIAEPETTVLSAREVAALGTTVIKKRTVDELQNGIMQDAARVIDGALAFSEIEPGQAEPPADWVERLGRKGAMDRLRMANAAWMSSKEAPVGLIIAKNIWVGGVKAAAMADSGPKVLNVAAQIVVPRESDYEAVDVE